MTMENSPPIRIWYQSFIDRTEHRPYFERLESYLAAIADPGVVYEVHGISPPDRELHRLTGIVASRASSFAQPSPQALHEFMESLS